MKNSENDSKTLGVKRKDRQTPNAPRAWPLLFFVMFMFCAHAGLYGSWIVDDAGITFAYSRNFARGHGLVPQPGLEPAEGYTNPTWMFFLSLFFLLRIFYVFWTVKIVSIALVFGGFAFLYRVLLARGGDGDPPSRTFQFAALLPLVLASLNVSFVVWTVSGLENPMNVFLTMALLWASYRFALRERADFGRGLGMGLLAALVGLTRPDGALYALAFPIVLVWRWGPFWRGPNFARLFRVAVFYCAGFALLYGSYFAFRVWYFNDIFPNTYYMKSDVSAWNFFDASKAGELFGGMLSLWGPAIVVAIVLLGVGLAVAKRLSFPAVTVGVFAAIAYTIYMVLPPDWMDEFRFATNFFALFYAFAFLAVVDLLAVLRARPAIKRRLAWTLAVVAPALTALNYSGRAYIQSVHPTLSFFAVQGKAVLFDKFADMLDVEAPSLLIADAGGTLFYSHMPVYDLGGLVDKTIGKTLGRDAERFHDYVFAKLRPTFIATHGAFTRKARFQDDPRFFRDYTLIYYYKDFTIEATPEENKYIGVFVRKDAIEGKEDIVLEIRREYNQRPFAATLRDWSP